MKTYWVGVRKDRYTGHDVFSDEEDNITPKNYPQYDYTIGPFASKTKAKKHAEKTKNKTDTFIDPFCNNGEGR